MHHSGPGNPVALVLSTERMKPHVTMYAQLLRNLWSAVRATKAPRTFSCYQGVINNAGANPVPCPVLLPQDGHTRRK